MKAQRVCEYCPWPSRAAVRSVVVTTQGRIRQKQHRAFVCADHLRRMQEDGVVLKGSDVTKKEQQS